jgi:ABC-type nitrate/sulfonate/bicarbonate transport system permease component
VTAGRAPCRLTKPPRTLDGMVPLTSVAPDVDHIEFDPTHGWESLLSVLVVLGGVAIAVLVAIGIGAWMTSRRAQLAAAAAESDGDPSMP